MAVQREFINNLNISDLEGHKIKQYEQGAGTYPLGGNYATHEYSVDVEPEDFWPKEFSPAKSESPPPKAKPQPNSQTKDKTRGTANKMAKNKIDSKKITEDKKKKTVMENKSEYKRTAKPIKMHSNAI